MKTILWWGRFDSKYSRNGVLRKLLRELGYQINDFHPIFSRFADLEASLRGLTPPDFVWVPCFRQRDVLAACRWAKNKNIPLIFDPLISAWDKQVFERNKFDNNSYAAIKLLKQEQKQFRCADTIIADTKEHAAFFNTAFMVPTENIKVIHVGADESIFQTGKQHKAQSNRFEVLFYGSFINLQGPLTIIHAARSCEDKTIQWHLLGRGPLLDQCKTLAEAQSNIVFEDWVDYKTLPSRIHQADVLLGVFGSSEKAGRVIPNKVYQSMACGRPVITRQSSAYPPVIRNGMESGIFQITENDPQALVDTVIKLKNIHETLPELGKQSRLNYEEYFSNDIIKGELQDALSGT